MPKKKMTLRQLTKRLEAAGVEDAAFDAAQLICRMENISHASLMAERERDFTDPALEMAARRREEGEPLQYILGEWEFMGVPIKVSPACLIPRADTEVLASLVAESLPKGGRFADLCTGSGCIAVSVLRLRPDATAAAAELYADTLETARKNAEMNGVDDRLELICADVCTDCLQGEFDIIAANPPYIAESEMSSLSREVQAEPRRALTDGGDGLSIIKSIIDIYPSHLKKDGILAVEIGWQQGDTVCEYAKRHGLSAEVLRDAGGRDRVVKMQKLS